MAEIRVKRPTNLTCLVCGSPCRCSYFGAVCCESCKVFFRRAVLSDTRYVCTKKKKKNTCEINVQTRRLCSSCRLKKCHTIGMLKEWVINSPRVGKMGKKKLPPETESPQSSDDVYPTHTCSLELGSDQFDIVDWLFNTTRKTIEDIPFPDELFVDEPTFEHIINVLSIVVKRMIAFTKTFSKFRALPIADQVTILKSVSLEIMLTRKATSLLHTVTEKHGIVWMVENGRFLFSKSNLANAYDETLYECYMRYITQLMNLEVDDKSLVILTCICLFSPDREHLSDLGKEILEREQYYYVSLLERYLHCNYSCEKARRVFPKMLMSQWCVRETSHYYRKAAMKCSNGEIEPLMKEFFNLE